MHFPAEEKYVKIMGRTLKRDGVLYLGYSCSSIEFTFVGKRAEAILWSDSPAFPDIHKAWVAVFVNDELEPSRRFPLHQEEDSYVLYEADTCKEVKLRLVKYSEAAFGKVGIKSLCFDGDTQPKPAKAMPRRIEFIGDSITCGYGNEGVWETDIFSTAQENPWEAYAAITARNLKADYQMVCWSGIGIISNYTEQDEPNEEWLMPVLYPYTDKACDLALGNEPELWDFSSFVPDIIVINLGTNDNSYTKSIPERVAVFASQYYEFLCQVRSSNPNSEILCTLGVMGQELCMAIREQVERLTAKGDHRLHYLTYEEQKPEDGIGTDVHPSKLTHQKVAAKLEDKIREIMNWQD